MSDIQQPPNWTAHQVRPIVAIDSTCVCWDCRAWRELVRLREQAEALADALEEAKGNLIWATGGWGQATEAVLEPARVALRKYIDVIDAALRTYREATQ